MYHPSRGGVRGGRDQFNWDDVKGDKHRENYLGHSIKAPVGRWQKGKDLHWYTRDKHSDEAAAREEIKRIQEEEDEAMQEMLGLAPKKRRQGKQLDDREVSELLKKVKNGEESDPSYAAGERIQGLGFAPAPGQTAPGQIAVAAKKTANVAYETDSAAISTGKGHGSREFTGNEGQRDNGEDGVVIVEAPAAVRGGIEDESNSASSEEEDASYRKNKGDRRSVKEREREERREHKRARRHDKVKRGKMEAQPGRRGDGARTSSSHIKEQAWKYSVSKERSYGEPAPRDDSEDGKGSGQEKVRKSYAHASVQLRGDSRYYHSSEGRSRVRHDSVEPGRKKKRSRPEE